jgi:hypothetical protein
MSFGIIGYSQVNQVNSTIQVGTTQSTPSGTIWGDSQNDELRDQGNGFYVDKDFKDATTPPGVANVGTFTYSSTDDSAIIIQVNSTGGALWTRPMAPALANGGTNLWYEVNVSPQQITAGQSMFFGLVTSTGIVTSTVTGTSSTSTTYSTAVYSTAILSTLISTSYYASTGSTLMAINPSTVTSTIVTLGTTSLVAPTLTPSSTTLLSTAGVIGFYMHGDAPSNLDAIYQKPFNFSSTSTSTTTVLANVLTAPQNNPNPGNLAYIPPVPPGAFTGSTWVKLGVRVDKTNAYWYVNGSLLAKKALDSSFDLTDSYGGMAHVLNLATSTSTGGVKMDFFRVAGKIL